MIRRLLKLVFVLLVLASIAFVAYAYLGPIFLPDDFKPPVEQVVEPITLGNNG